MSAEAVIDAIKYMFRKSVQVEDGRLVENIERADFVPKKYLEATLAGSEEEPDDNRPILLPKRIIDIPVGERTVRFVRRASVSMSNSAARERVVSHRASAAASVRVRERGTRGAGGQLGDVGESALRRDRMRP